jgi:transposase
MQDIVLTLQASSMHIQAIYKEVADMRKLQVEDADVMRIAIQDEIQRSEEARYDHRLHGVLLVSQGVSTGQVAEYFGEDPATVYRWVKRFNQSGFSGLQEGERPGRPPRLSQEQLEQVAWDLREKPESFGYQQNLWDGKLLSHHLQEQFGVELRVRQCQRLFRQLGFRRRKPRPLIAHADPEEQAKYKKTAPTGKGRKRRSVESG